MLKFDEKTLENIQSEVRGSKTLYEASAIAQEKHAFSKTANKVVIKTNVRKLFFVEQSTKNNCLRI